jgi:hypothetical protein
MPAGLRRQRAFVTPEPGEDWTALARRVLPGEPPDAAIAKLKSWNLHLFARIPPGNFLGSDVLFVEPPREGAAAAGG